MRADSEEELGALALRELATGVLAKTERGAGCRRATDKGRGPSGYDRPGPCARIAAIGIRFEQEDWP